MPEIATIACYGAGRMGRGIGHCLAYAGYEVALIDSRTRSHEAWTAYREQAKAEVHASLSALADIGGFEASAIGAILERVHLYARSEAGDALATADLVFEAVPETDEAKRDALAEIDRLARETAIVASTTSTYLSTQLAAWSGRPDRFLNAHWLNPAYLVPLVEVSPCEETDEAVLSAVNAFLEAIGKVPVTCKASPGYIVPRLQVLAMNEAARLVEEGVASAEDVDKAVRYGFGYRFSVLGLLEFIDWGGGDILFHASRYMADATGEDRFATPPIVRENMAAGRNGLRDGQGFYDYRDREIASYRRERMAVFLDRLKDASLHLPPSSGAGGGHTANEEGAT
ncbi:3-hydroxybutyryl-CoA dehydrogenase [Pararhizobium mangrovi]|uniref:L-gulonate 3-dehydrogenase n=1 Tax=Pararhizobium mangrovi TaxID=2590452 RepID=A0A506TXU6_9HYPH|nr:3-hydroxybutyryl-CoA dehydrogenase [Pararhizobium mangrovi]